jgi:sulfite reductase (NADPH) hemoprotein beta-component
LLVARIAYFSSDVVVSVQPSLSEGSGYSHKLGELAAGSVKGFIAELAQKVPEVNSFEI